MFPENELMKIRKKLMIRPRRDDRSAEDEIVNFGYGHGAKRDLYLSY